MSKNKQLGLESKLKDDEIFIQKTNELKNKYDELMQYAQEQKYDKKAVNEVLLKSISGFTTREHTNSDASLEESDNAASLANVIELIDNSDLVKFQEVINKNPELLTKTDDFGFSVLSTIIEKGNYSAKEIVMNTKISSKQPLYEDIETGLINASRQFHMEMSEIRDLVGHVFEGCDDWGIL